MEQAAETAVDSQGPSRRGFLLGSLASLLGLGLLGGCARGPRKAVPTAGVSAAPPLGVIPAWNPGSGTYPVRFAAGIADVTPKK